MSINKFNKLSLSLIAGIASSVTFSPMVFAQAGEVEEVTVLGSRRAGIDVFETAVPIDVITSEQIERSGFNQTVELLQSLVPSFNSFKNSITDATDYIRPAQLRGLGPEHVLVLVNGKRRHTSAVVHDNEQAKGSVNVDLNSIPPAAIASIEILRDGAAAQYGSDAIAGVINIKLKKSTKLEMSVTYGMNFSTEKRGYLPNEGLLPGQTDACLFAGNCNEDSMGDPLEDANGQAIDPEGRRKGSIVDWTDNRETKDHRDGETTIYSISKGFEIGDAFIHGSVQWWHQEPSSRSGVDPTLQYFARRESQTTPGTLEFTDSATAFLNAFNDADVTNDYALDPREVSFNRDENWWFGKSELTDLSAFVNAEIPINESHTVYAFGGYSERDGRGPCFWRNPNSNNTVRAIHPDGYLPNVMPEITDRSLTVGSRGEIAGFDYDVSYTAGHNDFNFKGRTLNASLGTGSPTFFEGGGTKFDQSTLNIDLTREVDIGMTSPLNVAFGAEYRKEEYEIYAGQTEAFINGGVAVLDGPNAGDTTVVGTQCAQAFNTRDEIVADRDNSAFYVDLETDFSRATVGFAIRAEDYSDFGSTSDGKLAFRYALTDAIAFRAAASTGFRAPALQQQYYQNISLQSDSSSPTGLKQTGTLSTQNEAAQLLGAKQLEAEESTSISAGFTVKTENFSLTIDGYSIDVDDRILLSNQFSNPLDDNGNIKPGFQDLRAFLQANTSLEDVTAVTYFINGLDTSTNGVDLVGKYSTGLQQGTLDLTLAANFTDTDVERVADTPAELTPFTDQKITGETLLNNVKNGAPEKMVNAIADFNNERFGLLWKSTYYGSILVAERFSADRPYYFQQYDGQWIHNAEASFKFDNGVTWSFGSNNLFDKYPNKRHKSQSFLNRLPYSGYVPYGFMGRYIYMRLSYSSKE